MKAATVSSVSCWSYSKTTVSVMSSASLKARSRLKPTRTSVELSSSRMSHISVREPTVTAPLATRLSIVDPSPSVTLAAPSDLSPNSIITPMGMATKALNPVSITASYSRAGWAPATRILIIALPELSNAPRISAMSHSTGLESSGRANAHKVKQSFGGGRSGFRQGLFWKIAQVNGLAVNIDSCELPVMQALKFGSISTIVDIRTLRGNLMWVGIVERHAFIYEFCWICASPGGPFSLTICSPPSADR
jgi:hypothetical protein